MQFEKKMGTLKSAVCNINFFLSSRHLTYFERESLEIGRTVDNVMDE